MSIVDNIKKNEIQSRMEIIGIIDPLRLNPTYNTLSVEQLKAILNKKTNSLADITHEQYQAIYDLSIDMPSRSNEIAILEYRISNLNLKVKELTETNEKLEEELLKTQLELERMKKTKIPKVHHEPGSFEAYVQEQDNEMLGIKRSNSLGGNSPHNNRLTYPNYSGYTPGRTNIQTIFANANISNSINGSLNEQDAIRQAIKESENLANKDLDETFTKSSSNDETPVIIDNKPIPWRQREDRYQHLKDKPISVTDETLDKIYDFLLLRDFDSVKQMLNSELPTEVVRWIRLLSYDGTNFKQMMVTKSHCIHKVFSQDI